MAVVIPPYSGWKPRSERNSRNKSEGSALSRESKRSRVLGSAQNRRIYISAHGYKHRDYAALCAKVSSFNK